MILEAGIHIAQSITPKSSSLIEAIEVILEFFSELVPTRRIRDITLTAVLLIQLVCHRETNEFFFLEQEIVLLNKVVDDVSLHHHVLGLIGVVVVPTKTPINPKTVISDLTKLISDLRHQRLIFISPTVCPVGEISISRRMIPDLGVSDLDRLVSADEKERVNPFRVSLNSLLIDENRLMCDHAIE